MRAFLRRLLRNVRPPGKIAVLFATAAMIVGAGISTAGADPTAPARFCPAGVDEAVAVNTGGNSYTVLNKTGLRRLKVKYDSNGGNPIDKITVVAKVGRQIVAYLIHTDSGDTVSYVGDPDVPRDRIDAVIPVFGDPELSKVLSAQVCTAPK